MPTPFEEVMNLRGLDAPEDGEVTITGHDPVLPARFKLGEAASGVLAGIGVAVTDIHELKGGQRQKIAIDVRQAAAAMRSGTYMSRPTEDGGWARSPMTPRRHHARQLGQPWQCKDGRWFFAHFNLPHLQKRVLSVLGCEAEPEAVEKAMAKRDAQDLEDAIAEVRACGTIVRSNAEWLAHPHGAMLATRPMIEIEKIGDTDPIPFPDGARPLDGIRVLDLTRILAGPITARTLAENGADVLMVTAEHLPQVQEHVMDTSHGKRSCFLDLTQADEHATLMRLVETADVFSQGYRPGIMNRLGLSPQDLAERRPGIVYLSIDCYGAGGPLSDRAGWEQVAQSASGVCMGNGENGRPKLLPAAACDYTTGYNGALGVLLALGRRAREGGSYHVRVSLCQTAMYIYRQGLIDFPDPNMDVSQEELDAIMIETDTGFGPLRHLAPIVRMSETRPFWDKPAPALGSGTPVWL